VAVQHGAARHPAEVIIPAYACPDVVSAVRFAGATPVVADVLPGLPWLDPRSVASVMSRHTVAVLYVRFLGLPANDLALRAVCRESGALLVEDAAHAFPVGSPVRSSADLVVLSFGRGKPVSLRHGGLLLQRSDGSLPEPPPPLQQPPRLTDRIRQWLECASYNAGIHPTAYSLLSRVMRTDAIQYRELNALTPVRRELTPHLKRAIQSHDDVGTWRQRRVATIVSEVGYLLFDVARHAAASGTAECSSTHGGEEWLWRYPLLLPTEVERDRLFADLWKHGLGPSRMYRMLLPEMAGLAPFVRATSTPNARAFAERLLTLPLHSDVTADDYRRIHARLQAFAEQPCLAQPNLWSH
jgi:dTDP-4-amino-4,6-dideoxygalactose transaminase